MKDGLYRVELGDVCAGFVVRDGKVTECAPILRKRFRWWCYYARRVGP